jgi:putative transposase
MFAVMTRHTTFRLCLDPTVEQREVLARHTGAARFAFNQCLAMVKTALTQRRADPDTEVPWTGFDLINAFNGWKKTEDASRVFTVDTAGVAEVVVTGLRWRDAKCVSRTAATPPPDSRATTSTPPMRAAISCTGCPASWSRPTIGS